MSNRFHYLSCFQLTSVIGFQKLTARWHLREPMYRFVRGPRLALFALLTASALFAQRDLATLVGTVTDSSGAVVGNAKVTVTETETGQVYALLTSSNGE